MNIERLFCDEKFLDKEFSFFKRHIRLINSNDALICAHFDKCKHNLQFYDLNKTQKKYADWLLVILYYSLYHACLALLARKGYATKNHYATLLVLIREYGISRDDAQMINALSVTKSDASLYSQLKEQRHTASYSTSTISASTVKYFHTRVIEFINKTDEIIH